MKLIQSDAYVIYPETKEEALEMLRRIERAGRTCYKSESESTAETAVAFVRMLLRRGHESVIEHGYATVRFIVDRGVSHEIVRHRLASYSQESTRYCSYKDGIKVIDARHQLPRGYCEWNDSCASAGSAYLTMLDSGAKPEMARSVLPQSTKTEIVMTANLREWRHFFKLRTHATAHPQMREVTRPLLRQFRHFFPVLFDRIELEFELERATRAAVFAVRSEGWKQKLLKDIEKKLEGL